jgi:hypothetical protein
MQHWSDLKGPSGPHPGVLLLFPWWSSLVVQDEAGRPVWWRGYFLTISAVCLLGEKVKLEKKRKMSR